MEDFFKFCGLLRICELYFKVTFISCFETLLRWHSKFFCIINLVTGVSTQGNLVIDNFFSWNFFTCFLTASFVPFFKSMYFILAISWEIYLSNWVALFSVNHWTRISTFSAIAIFFYYLAI